jgi:abortive infection protein
MLTWLAVYLVGTLCLPTAAGVFSALGCLAATLFCGRDAPLCGVPAEKLRYSKIEYACALGLLVSGSALLSFATSLVLRFGGAGQAAAAGQGNFLAALVFSCLVPAFFEELLLRGRVLGLLHDAHGGGVWLCAALFALMHTDFARLPYAFFAGVVLSALVYLGGNLYVGMLFHFLNNLASLALSRLPDAAAYGAAALLALLFCACIAVLRQKPLFADAKALLAAPRAGGFVRTLDGTLWLYAAAALALCVLKLF